jgi:hypothetical protein
VSARVSADALLPFKHVYAIVFAFFTMHLCVVKLIIKKMAAKPQTLLS